MGYYIETGSNKGKANWLRSNAKAISFNRSQISSDLIPVVVVDNGPFEAAAIAFNSKELDEFLDPDGEREVEKLLVPRMEVIRLCPRVEKRLEWVASDK